MSSVPTLSPTVDEGARRGFEAAWREGRPRPIEQFLPAQSDPHFLATLEQLILIELELAWKASAATLGVGDALPTATASRAPLVEDYLARFPALNRPEVVRRLLEQEYRVRRRWGDQPAADNYRGRFPSLPLTLHESVAPPTAPELPAIPGYDVLAELGRGAMGVVYKARQLGLNRLVALKMILAGPYASPEGLERFRAEAEAIAAVQHPNIVQIHEIGEHAGAAYIALEYVEGDTLARKLSGAPQPARRAAEMMETLARAVESAHRHGVVHRDLKPANVLVTMEGLLKITDFGLAKRLEEGPGRTRTGVVVGTPSYMAPEQAEGRQKEVGPACDVYALGAILYEMLTGRPPFRAESVLETLQQVLVDDPVPPRRLQPRAPRDLELIALKCLRKKPRERYAGAEALADDLRRFLNNEPIRARPAPPWERAAKWARRHPAGAALLLAGVLAALALAAGAWWHDAQLRAERDETERQKMAAQTQQHIAEQQKTEADSQRQKAEDESRMAQDAIFKLAEAAKSLAEIPRTETVRKDLLMQALDFYDLLPKDVGRNPARRKERALTCQRMGDLQCLLQSQEDAVKAYSQAAAMQEQLADEFPGERDYRADLAATYHRLATALLLTDGPDAAAKPYQQALEILTKLREAFPDTRDYRDELAVTYNDRGAMYFTHDRFAEAMADLGQALELRKALVEEVPDRAAYQKGLAAIYNNLGETWEQKYPTLPVLAIGAAGLLGSPLGQGPLLAASALLPDRTEFALVEALQAHDEALKLRDKLSAGSDNPDYRTDLAFSYNNRSQVWLALGHLAAKDRKWVTAYEDYYKAEADDRQVIDTVIRDSDEKPEARRVLAAAYGTLALVSKEEGNRDGEVRDARRQAVEIRKKLVADFPDPLDYRRGLAIGYSDLGLSLEGAEAEGDFRRAVCLLTDLSDQHPDVPEYLIDLDNTLTNLADFHFGRAEPSLALEPLKEAIRRLEAARKSGPDNSLYSDRLRNHQSWLAEAFVRLQRHAEAVQAAEELPRIIPEGPEEYHRAAGYLSRCIPIAEDDPNLPEGKGQEIAGKYAAEAIALLRQAVCQGFKDAEGLKYDGAFAPLRARAPAEFQKVLDQIGPPR